MSGNINTRRARNLELAINAFSTIAVTLWMYSGARPQLQAHAQTRLATTPVATDIPYADAESILASLRENLPAGLISKAPADLSRGWRDWVLRRKNEMRVRLDRGDEDSIVNFWYYGTSFTKLPPLS